MPPWYARILKQYDEERKTKAFYETQGFQKLWLYLLAIIDTSAFQARVREARERYGIPIKGFATTERGSWRHPIEAWRFSKTDEERVLMRDIRDELSAWCREYSLLPRDWEDVLESYLFYNRPFIGLQPGGRNLCFVADAVTNKDGLGGEVTEDYRLAFPAMLMISPYASERDVIDYVKKVFKPEIERVQKRHRKPEIKIGSFKKRSVAIRKRNAFIYERRLGSNKKVAREVRERYPDAPLKNTSVHKVIQRERRRRQ